MRRLLNYLGPADRLPGAHHHLTAAAELPRCEHPKLRFLHMELATLCLLAHKLDPTARLSLGISTSILEFPAVLLISEAAVKLDAARRRWAYAIPLRTFRGDIIGEVEDTYNEGYILPDPTAIAKNMWLRIKASRWTENTQNNLWVYKDCLILALQFWALAPTDGEDPDPISPFVQLYYRTLYAMTPDQVRRMGVEPSCMIQKVLAYRDAHIPPRRLHATIFETYSRPFCIWAVVRAYKKPGWRALLLDTFRCADKESLPFDMASLDRNCIDTMALRRIINSTPEGSEADIVTILRRNNRADMLNLLPRFMPYSKSMPRFVELLDAEY